MSMPCVPKRYIGIRRCSICISRRKLRMSLTDFQAYAIICTVGRELVSMSTHPEGRRHGMEKRVMGIFWRPCVALIALTFTAITANAQLVLDGGFELGPGGPWTVFNGALQNTNYPHSGVYSMYTAGPFGANFDA